MSVVYHHFRYPLLLSDKLLDTEFTYALIQTKLNRPPLPVDLVTRSRLTAWLDLHRERPLALVCAPAGYGKSVLISCWLESVDCPAAWLSLDEWDNDLGVFLSYFLAAIQTIFPDALLETEALLLVTPLPPLSAITKVMVNELNQIAGQFILVLDDYHLIEAEIIHDLLKALLRHPPRNFHLVLGTRTDPPLPLANLRAKSQVTEIRTQDLRFNQDEALQLFQKMIGTHVDPAAFNELDAQAEGWVTGLRLVALGMSHRIGRDTLPKEFSTQNRYVTEYLITEILARQAASLSDCMLKISLLDRFCADLCEAVCFQDFKSTDNSPAESISNGFQFLEWLQAANFFLIPLDDQNEWFRFHHFFRDTLQKELARRFGPKESRFLHAAAGHWFAENNLIEEALTHLLASGETISAIEVVSQHRYRLMNDARWSRLERWLNLFPVEVIENSAELWMLKTWLAYHGGLWLELPSFLDQLMTIMSQDPDQGQTNSLAGEISSLSSLLTYYGGDADAAISHANQALETLPAESWSIRILARIGLGGGLRLKGDIHGGYHAFYDAFSDEKVQNKPFKANLLMAAGIFHWDIADLDSTAQAAQKSIALSQETGLRETLGLASYQLGCVRYQQNNLPAAEKLFARVVTRPYQSYGQCYVNSACGLALTYQAQGREVEACEVVEATIAFLLETGNTTQLPLTQVLQAEMALLQGRLSAAIQWAEKFDAPPPLGAFFGFLTPHLTLIKVWLAQNTPSSQENAAQLLRQLETYFKETHNTLLRIETLALQALLDDLMGEQTAALTRLEKALRLSQPGGFIRLFVDLGTRMESLLTRMNVGGELKSYLDQIQAAFPRSADAEVSKDREEVLASLTNRELQVLKLLGRQLTNKEIAAQLVISLGTVKAHNIRIYKKLGVNSRRQAVEKAVALGIL